MKKLKKLFFYILGGSISFLGVFKTNAFTNFDNGNQLRPLYGVDIAEMQLNLINWILGFIGIIISPIIFLIGLYFYLTKKGNKERKEKAIKYMKRAVILAVVVFLLGSIIKLIFDFLSTDGTL